DDLEAAKKPPAGRAQRRGGPEPQPANEQQNVLQEVEERRGNSREKPPPETFEADRRDQRGKPDRLHSAVADSIRSSTLVVRRWPRRGPPLLDPPERDLRLRIIGAQPRGLPIGVGGGRR